MRGRGHAWQGVCVAGELGDMHGRGVMCGREGCVVGGHAWRGGGACVAGVAPCMSGETATAVECILV